MSGYSDRLAVLEAKPELSPTQRGELRSMAAWANEEEQQRIERLLNPPQDSTTSAAYERGVELGIAAANRR